MERTRKQYDISATMAKDTTSMTQWQLAKTAALEPYKVKRTFFIAVGFGSHLILITINIPKSLIRVHGIRIIDYLLGTCLGVGINDIIVRGYLVEQLV